MTDHDDGLEEHLQATDKYDAKLFRKPPADHPVYVTIGRVASEWSHLENMLDWTIWELAGLDEQRGSCITSQMMGHAPRFLALIALLKQRKVDANFISRAQELLRKTYDLAEERNRYVHDAWYIDVDDGTTHQTKGASRREVTKERSELTFGIRPVGHDADDLIDKIRKRLDQVATLRNDVFGALSP